MSKNKGKGKEREKPATEDQDAPSGQSTATAASATPAKRRKNAPSKLPAVVTDSPSTSDDEPGITVKLRPNRKGLRIDAVRLSTALLLYIHHADLSSTCM